MILSALITARTPSTVPPYLSLVRTRHRRSDRARVDVLLFELVMKSSTVCRLATGVKLQLSPWWIITCLVGFPKRRCVSCEGEEVVPTCASTPAAAARTLSGRAKREFVWRDGGRFLPWYSRASHKTNSGGKHAQWLETNRNEAKQTGCESSRNSGLVQSHLDSQWAGKGWRADGRALAAEFKVWFNHVEMIPWWGVGGGGVPVGDCRGKQQFYQQVTQQKNCAMLYCWWLQINRNFFSSWRIIQKLSGFYLLMIFFLKYCPCWNDPEVHLLLCLLLFNHNKS